MVYRGHIKDGRVVLDESTSLPEGVEVRVEVVDKRADESAEQGSTLGQRLMKLSGIAKGLPADASVNHDHYIYGTPKRTGE